MLTTKLSKSRPDDNVMMLTSVEYPKLKPKPRAGRWFVRSALFAASSMKRYAAIFILNNLRTTLSLD